MVTKGFRKSPRRVLRARFELLRACKDMDASSFALPVIEQSIESMSTRFEMDTKGYEEEYREILGDELRVNIENLLGIAFIICQVQITAIVSSVIKLHEIAEEYSLCSLKTCSKNKSSIITFGTSLVGDTEYSAIQVIDAAANCYKHFSEWTYDWENLNGQQQPTVKILHSLGCSHSRTGNFRMISKILGNKDFSDVMKMHNYIDEWYENIVAAYSSELRSKGYL